MIFSRNSTVVEDKLSNSPVLADLYTDASVKGFGSVLLRSHMDKEFHPIEYYSKCT